MAIAACSRMRLSPCSSVGEIGATAVGRLEAADADDAARRHQRAELETHVRQGAGLPARRLALLERPARRAGFARVERVDGRPGGAEDEIAVLGQQHHDAARVERLLRIDGRRLQDVVERDGAGKLARKFEQRARRLGAFARQALLVARAAGEPAHENGGDQEDGEREKFMRLVDAEFISRLDEEEIVGEKGKNARRDRGAQAEAHGAEQHRDRGRSSTDWAGAATD